VSLSPQRKKRNARDARRRTYRILSRRSRHAVASWGGPCPLLWRPRYTLALAMSYVPLVPDPTTPQLTRAAALTARVPTHLLAAGGLTNREIARTEAPAPRGIRAAPEG
jgi:hypothetical protein